jgi:hypothetical protein
MARSDREKYLAQFRAGELKVLCACDILNEGWDCPDVEVLLMARPTLSKVVYMQQLGRGTRKAPGKECLVVIDFVDNSLKYNQAINIHRILGVSKYRPGGLVLAPEELKRAEDAAIDRNEQPTTVIDIGLWAKAYQLRTTRSSLAAFSKISPFGIRCSPSSRRCFASCPSARTHSTTPCDTPISARKRMLVLHAI